MSTPLCYLTRLCTRTLTIIDMVFAPHIRTLAANCMFFQGYGGGSRNRTFEIGFSQVGSERKAEPRLRGLASRKPTIFLRISYAFFIRRAITFFLKHESQVSSQALGT